MDLHKQTKEVKKKPQHVTVETKEFLKHRHSDSDSSEDDTKGRSSRASEDSYKNWLRAYSLAHKEGTKEGRNRRTNRSENSPPSIYLMCSPKISHVGTINYPELNEQRPFIFSVVEPINYEELTMSKLRLQSNLTNFKRKSRNHKPATPVKSRPYIEEEAKAEAETEAEVSAQKLEKYKQKFESQAQPNYTFDSLAEGISAQYERDLLEEKRIAVQAKISELMKIVQIREIKRKKPKRDFLKEAQTHVWPTRKSQKDTIEKKIPKTRFTTKMEVIKMPAELSHLKPIRVRRYSLNKRKELETGLNSNQKDLCGTCCMFGLGKKKSDTPLIREMKAKNDKINLLTYCHLWKQRQKAL